MNSKAIKRQLLAAIAMVLVAAIALGSSTYAWFVASGTVTAEGMKVQAASEGGLAISVDGKAWGTSADANVTAKLLPASTMDLKVWSHATAEKVNASKAKAGTRSLITDTVYGGAAGAFADDNGYVVMKEFKIRSTGTTDTVAKGLYVSNVTVTAPAAQMSTALRVGVMSQGKTYIYGPVNITNPGNSEFGNTATDNYPVYGNSETALGTVTLSKVGEDSSVILSKEVEIPTDGENAIKVQVFIWYEGEDKNLNTELFNNEQLNVTVEFTSMEGGYKPSGV